MFLVRWYICLGCDESAPYQKKYHDLVYVWVVANFLSCQIANAPMPILVLFSSQCWPTHGQAQRQPKFCLAKVLVGQPWA